MAKNVILVKIRTGDMRNFSISLSGVAVHCQEVSDQDNHRYSWKFFLPRMYKYHYSILNNEV